MKKSLLFLGSFLFAPLVLTLAGNASAAQISVVSMVGNWRAPVYEGAGGVSGIVNGDPTSSINWGGTVAISGYDFTKSIPGTQTLPPAPTPLFPLGTFTHRNRDLSVNSDGFKTLKSVKLDIVVSLSVDGTNVGPLTFTFTFNHDETNNTNFLSECDPAKLNPTSTVPCPDVVSFTASPTPTTFKVGGVDYTLAMSFVDSQGQPVARFITEEKQNNVANLVGQFTLPPPPPSCGNNICDGTDTCSNCPGDCNVCTSPAPAITFTASPNPINAGGTSTLNWAITDANTASIDQGVGSISATSGSSIVTPPNTTTYTLTATGPGGTATKSVTVTVNGTNQPPASQIQFNPASYSVNEDEGFETIVVTRTGDTSIPATVHFASADGTAKAGLDYLTVSGTLTFKAGDTSETFDVPVLDDRIVDGGETVNLDLTSVTNATLGTSHAVLTINDQNPTPPAAPAPFISELVPNTAPAGFRSNFQMRVLGSGFAQDAQVHWNFNGVDSVFSGPVVVSSTEIDVTVQPGQVSQAGLAAVTVVNVSAALTSNAATFTVRQPGTGYPPPFIGVPSANPNPTYTKTTTLTVQGGTLTGGTVSYTWSLAGTNPASNVTFTKNNSDGSSATATFPPTTGTVIYHLKATITDNQSQFSVDSVPVDVTVIQNATSLTVGPPNPTYTVGQAQPLNLTANIVDQWGIAMTAPTTWTESGGSLAPSGTTASFTNTDVNIGNVTVTATAVNALNLPVSGSRVVKIIVVGAGMGGDLSTARAYPVPWKSNGGDPYIHFTGLVSDTKIRIFSITGHIVQTLHSPSGCNGLSCDVPWDIKNANFDRVASGVYPFIIEGAGQKKEGKLVIIQ